MLVVYCDMASISWSVRLCPLVGAARDRYHSGFQEFPICGIFTIEAHEGFDGGGPVVGA